MKYFKNSFFFIFFFFCFSSQAFSDQDKLIKKIKDNKIQPTPREEIIFKRSLILKCRIARLSTRKNKYGKIKVTKIAG